jgi:hypothetical protein
MLGEAYAIAHKDMKWHALAGDSDFVLENITN